MKDRKTDFTVVGRLSDRPGQFLRDVVDIPAAKQRDLATARRQQKVLQNMHWNANKTRSQHCYFVLWTLELRRRSGFCRVILDRPLLLCCHFSTSEMDLLPLASSPDVLRSSVLKIVWSSETCSCLPWAHQNRKSHSQQFSIARAKSQGRSELTESNRNRQRWNSHL